MKSTIKFPNLTYYTSADLGTITVGVYRNSTSIANITLTAANYDPTTYKWTVSWVVPWNALLGTGYNFTIRANEVIDKFGNKGPSSAVSSNMFRVVKVIPTVPNIYTDKPTYVRGSMITIYFAATYLDGSPVTTGSASITLIRPDLTTVSLTATYSTTQARFQVNWWLPDYEQTGGWTVKLAAHGLSDGAANTGPIADRKREFEVTPPVPPGALTVEIHPETLNLKSEGRWITCYIKPPTGYDVASIDLSTVELWYKGKYITASWGNIEGNVLMVKFDRSQLINLFQQAGVNGGEHGRHVELTIKAEVSGELCEGTDTIRVTSPGGGSHKG